MPPQYIEEVEEQQREETACIVCEYIGDQTPDLTLQDRCLVKAQQLQQSGAVCGDGDQGHDRSTDHNVEHQIGNAPILMLIAKDFESFS